MALVAAVIGSFLGAVLGVLSMVFLGASFVAAFLLYVTVSILSVAVCAVLMLRRSGEALGETSAEMRAVYARYEEEIDADWLAHEARERAGSDPRQASWQGPPEPVSADDRRAGRDRRGGDRRNSA
jgi:hypothetical protein